MKKIILGILSIFICCSIFAETAVMMQPSGSLFEEKDGLMVWKKSVDEGTELEVLSLEKKVAKREVNGKEIDAVFYNVSFDEKKYWVLTDRVSVGQKPAVILKDCAIYTNPDIASFKNTNFNAGEFVALGKEVTANSIFRMIEVSYFDEKNYVVRNAYIRVEKASSDKEDLKAMKLYEKIVNAKDDIIRNELFISADGIKCKQEIKDLFNEYREYLEAMENQAAAEEILFETDTSMLIYANEEE